MSATPVEHDDACEAEYVQDAHAWTACRCAERTLAEKEAAHQAALAEIEWHIAK